MKISKEQLLAFKISIFLLIFALFMFYFIQYLNHNSIVDFRWQGQNKFILIFILLSIFTYLIAYILAKITIKPIEENNKKLREYNHNLAHEIKTPLAVVKTNLELLELWYDKNLVVSSIEEINSMRDITDNLLFLSENTTLKNNEKVSFLEIIKDLEININLDVKKDFIINGNKVLVERLLTNLVENAKKYKISNSKIQIFMDKNTFKISNKIKKSIVLEDTSILFDTFYKLDNSRNTVWFWLGLSIVKKICDLHNLEVNIKIIDWKFEVEMFN